VIGTALALYLLEALRGFPLVVYFLVDAATALVASAFTLRLPTSIARASLHAAIASGTA
jgi:hypothetical protein